MKSFKFIPYLFLALVLGLVGSCKEETFLVDVQLQVNPTALSFLAYDEPKAVVVTCNSEWQAAMENPDDASWCNLSQNGDTLMVTVSDNSDVNSGRSGNIIVSSGDKKQVITVSQEESKPAQIVLNPKELRLECEGMVPSQVKVLTTVKPIKVSWSAEGKPDWMTDPVISGDTITFTALDNPTKLERKTKVAVIVGPESNQASDTLTLIQAPNAPYIKIMPDTIHLDYKGTPTTFDVYYNATISDEDFLGTGKWSPDHFYECELMPELTQVRSENMKARRNTYKIWAPVNPTTEVRSESSFMAVTLDGGTPDEVYVLDNVIIMQDAAPVASITASETNLLFASVGASQTLTITTTIDGWKAVSNNSWIQVSQEGNKLKVTVSKNSGNAERSGSLTLTCGTGSNTATLQVPVVQAGASSGFTLSTKSVDLAADGSAQTIKVVTDIEDWWVEGAPEWLHVKSDVAKGTITLTADPASATRTASLKVLGTKNGKRVEAAVSVQQLKKYKVGEVYKVDGKPVGIVFYTSDGGNHGYVFSLDDNGLKADPNNALHWSVDMYAGYGTDSEALKNSEPVCLDQNDGRNNMAAVKRCSNPVMNGRSWQECYPVMAWADQYARNHSGQEWYLPSRNELDKLAAYLNGIYDGSGVTTSPADDSKREAARNAVNKLLKDNGGTPFYWDMDADQGVYLNGITMLISSTEVGKNDSGLGFVGVYQVKPLHYAVTGVYATHARGDVSDPSEPTVTSIRMMFRF